MPQRIPAKEFWTRALKGIGRSREPLIYDISSYHEWASTHKKTPLKDAARQVQELNAAIVEWTGASVGDREEYKREQVKDTALERLLWPLCEQGTNFIPFPARSLTCVFYTMT